MKLSGSLLCRAGSALWVLAWLFASGPQARAQQSAYASAVTNTPGAIGYFPFSVAAGANSAVGGHTGSFQGNAALGPEGSGALPGDPTGNTALLLDGNASYVSTTLTGGLDTNQGSFIAWFKLTALPSAAGHIFTIVGESQVGNDFDLQIELDNKIKFYTDSGSATVVDAALTEADLNVWHFVAAAFTSGASRNIYLDGRLAASSTPGGHNPSGNGRLVIGESDIFRGRFFQGAIDEVAVFKRELSAGEVAAFYTSGSVPSAIMLDPAFNPGAGADAEVRGAVFQPDGKALIVGAFSAVGGVPRNGVARVNADGSLDASFNPGSGADDTVNAALLLPDGKILIGGDFSAYNGTKRNGLARLNADGSLDASFDAKVKAFGGIVTFSTSADSSSANLRAKGRLMRRGAGINAPGFVSSLSLQSNGQIIFSGDFGKVAGAVALALARLNADGSLDASFHPGAAINGKVRATAVQSDGKTIIGGEFTLVSNQPRGGVARLKADGSLDASFDPGEGAQGGAVNAVAVQPDGSALIGGEFTSVNNAPRARIARVKANGSVDESFNPGAGADGAVRTLALQSDGKTIFGGEFQTVAGAVAAGLARLNANGSLDASFSQTVTANGKVSAVALRGDGKVLAAGDFTSVAGQMRNRLALVDANANAPAQNGAAPPVVTVSAGVGTTAPGRAPGVVFIQRTGDTSADLIVRYSAGGNAAAGQEYAALSGQKKIKAGKATASVKIKPLAGGAALGMRKVQIKLQADSAYRVGDPAKAKVIIQDSN
jgi:uncharacterized delta-60 repeat protein